VTTTKTDQVMAVTVPAYAVPDQLSACQVVSHQGGKTFQMNIQFAGSGSDTCAAGEYRQYVRGTYKWRAGASGDWTTLVHLLRNGVPIDPAVYHEDGFTDGGAYGYRSFNGCSDNFYTDSAHTVVNRAAGCYYHGTDFPSITHPTGQYKLELGFKGQAVVAASGTVLQESTWDVNCEGAL
jgi:hypothetical protein